MVELLVGETLTTEPQKQTPAPLAIASCGNAALAAAVVAKAAERRLLVFIPTDAEASVVSALRDLDAEITVCERRSGESGDPCYLRFQEAVRAGAIPFCCQGPDSGLTIEGGQTLLAEALCEITNIGRTLSRMVVQVGGGALASSCALAMETGLRNGLLAQRPRFYTAQTESVAPLARAWQRLLDVYGDALPMLSDSQWSQVAAHKRRYMWPWEHIPHSAAHGILDDETYDWLSAIQAMARSFGRPLVVPEQTIVAAHSLAARATGVAVTATGTAGLAGLLQLHKEEPLHPDENVLCLFTGVMR
jgi:threonine synthase